MIPKAAITKAVEGGWYPDKEIRAYAEPNLIHIIDKQIGRIEIKDWEAVALDPTFWQCLGKSLGWKWDIEPFDKEDPSKSIWAHEAMQFYLLILTGGSTEQFWDELLGNK